MWPSRSWSTSRTSACTCGCRRAFSSRAEEPSSIQRPGERLRHGTAYERSESAPTPTFRRGAPPGVDRLPMGRLHRLPETRHQELCSLTLRKLQQRFGRLIPGMHAERKGPPVNRQERPATEERQRLECVLWTQVHVTPGGVKRADLEHHQIERPEPLADRLVFGGESRVPAEEKRVSRRADDER